MDNRIELQQGTRLFVGNAVIVLAAATVVEFEALANRDQVAEVLAENPTVYAAHRASLTHEIEGERDGQRVRIEVSYGIGGSRVERILEVVEETQTLQPVTEQVEGFDVVLTPSEGGGFTVTVPELTGVVAEGETLEEARAAVATAILAFLESLKQDNGAG